MDIKKEYNELLKRYDKAVLYFNRDDIPREVKEKQIKNYQAILDGLNFYLGEIKTYTNKEAIEGFN